MVYGFNLVVRLVLQDLAWVSRCTPLLAESAAASQLPVGSQALSAAPQAAASGRIEPCLRIPWITYVKDPWPIKVFRFFASLGL